MSPISVLNHSSDYKSDFKCIGDGSDSTPKQEASAHAPGVTDLTEWI